MDSRKQLFSQQIRRLIHDKGWTQSELSRRAELPRDSISVYIRGKSLPTPQSLQKLASALGVTREELMPSNIGTENHREMSTLEIKGLPNSPGMAHLRIDKIVPLPTALKVAGLLSDDISTDFKLIG
jgi:transcriptional regulator with XRE-family HTH domain